MEENYLKVIGKGNKERFVPITDNTKKALISYLNAWRIEPQNGCQNLILSEDGLPMTVGALLQMIKRLGAKAGIPRLHPHLFRHSFSVKFLVNGGDVMTLRRILGHTTLSVTEHYMHLADVHISLKHQSFSPVANLNLGLRRRRSALRP